MRHRLTSSLDAMRRRGCLYHIFACSYVHGILTPMMLCHGHATSYDMVRDRTTIVQFNRVQMMTSASRQTTIVKSYYLIRLSYDGRTMPYYFHTIIYLSQVRLKSIFSSVTTKLRLQYRSRAGNNHRYLEYCPIVRRRNLV